MSTPVTSPDKTKPLQFHQKPSHDKLLQPHPPAGKVRTNSCTHSRGRPVSCFRMNNHKPAARRKLPKGAWKRPTRSTTINSVAEHTTFSSQKSETLPNDSDKQRQIYVGGKAETNTEKLLLTPVPRRASDSLRRPSGTFGEFSGTQQHRQNKGIHALQGAQTPPARRTRRIGDTKPPPPVARVPAAPTSTEELRERRSVHAAHARPKPPYSYGTDSSQWTSTHEPRARSKRSIRPPLHSYTSSAPFSVEVSGSSLQPQNMPPDSAPHSPLGNSQAERGRTSSVQLPSR